MKHTRINSLLEAKAVGLNVVRRIILQISHREVHVPRLVPVSTESWLDLSIKLLDSIGESFGLLQVEKFLVSYDVLHGVFKSLVEN
jgi:hypothetical protein